DHRVELLRPVLDDHELTAAGRLVELLAHGLFLDDVDEAHHAAEVRDDRLGVRIPAEEQVSDLDLLTILDGEGGTVGNREPGAHDAVADAHQDLALTGGDDARSVRRIHRGDTLELRLTLHLAAALRLSGDTRRGTTDVEGPQRQLGARLADRLRGQDAHGLTDIHHLHGGEVAAVALLAEPAAALARQHRANLHARDAAVLDHVRGILVDQLARLHEHLAVDRVHHV